MKTIAFYIGSLEKGGAERVFVNLSEFFNSIGYRVVMVTQYKKENEYVLIDDVKRVISDIQGDEISNSRIVNFFRRLFKLRKIWKTEDIDLAIACAGKNNFMTVVSSMGVKTKPVVSLVGEARLEYPGKIMKLLANILFPLSAGVILQTEKSREFFNKAVNKKAVVLPNSLNPKFIRPVHNKERDKLIVAVGRMDENKRHKMLIDAFSKLNHRFDEYKLVIYGDGELKDELLNQIDELKLKDRVALPGVVNDIPDRLMKAKIFVIVSDSEGVSNALMEAMASGLAVISTDVPSGGATQLIDNGKNGLIIPVGDEDALVKSMELLLSDDDLCKKLGKAALDIQETLSPNTVNNQWKDYFESILIK